jgi:hypothetical protein
MLALRFFLGINYKTSSDRAHVSGSMVSIAAFAHFGAQLSTQCLPLRDSGIDEAHI